MNVSVTTWEEANVITNTLNREIPIPLYYQLEMLIKEQIRNGTLAPGDQLPTEEALCETYDVSRAPVRQALAALAQEGLIERRPGIGTFVINVLPKRDTNV